MLRCQNTEHRRILLYLASFDPWIGFVTLTDRRSTHAASPPRARCTAGATHGVACAQPGTWRALRGPDRHKGAVDPSVLVQHLGGRLGGVFGGAQGWRQEVQGDHAAAREHVHREHRRGAPCVRLPASAHAHAPPPSPHKQVPGLLVCRCYCRARACALCASTTQPAGSTRPK